MLEDGDLIHYASWGGLRSNFYSPFLSSPSSASLIDIVPASLARGWGYESPKLLFYLGKGRKECLRTPRPRSAPG